MAANDYFPPQADIDAATIDAFEKILAAKWDKPIVDTFRMGASRTDIGLITSTLRASVPWLVAIIIALLISGIVQAVKYRRSYKIDSKDLKSPPHSMWFGTIPELIELYKTSPQDVHPMTTLTLLHRKYQLGDLYFSDNWPGADRMHMLLNSPELAAQVLSLPKYDLYPHFIGHLTGSRSMLFSEGQEWKRTRGLFNPGFAISHLMTLVPSIVDDTAIFQRKFGELADSGEVKPIEELLARLTIDIMGHIILDHDLNSQTTENEMVTAFRAQVYWTPNPMSRRWMVSVNLPFRFMQWHYTRRMDNYIRKVIRERSTIKSTGSNMSKTQAARRPAIDLAVEEYNLGSEGKTIDKEFEQVAIDQMKTFLFAGHDTSSSTLCYVYYLLDLHPEALAKTRAEHERVFGPSVSSGEAIKARPQLLNELPYTTAVIKEALRLFPPASSVRNGVPGFSIIHDGVAYPTEGKMIWINNHTIQRRADLFPEPDAFIPERFLTGADMWAPQVEIKKDSWRPFEKGPRACIGQELAMLEMKIIMVMTSRDFDIKADYAQWERKMGRQKPGDDLNGKRTMFGYRAFPQMKAAAKPADGLPARVVRRKQTSS